MNRTHWIILASATAIVAVVLVVGLSILNALNAEAEQEEYDRSWESCSALFDNLSDIVECHARNVSD